MKKIKYLVYIVFVLSWLSTNSAAFKDVTPELETAAGEFSQEGLFGSFIFQYGEDLFRPNGYVTRDNLVLVLKEYHILTKRLITENTKMQKKIKVLESKNISQKNIDLILQEFQNILDPMLQQSKTIKSLQAKSRSAAAVAVPASSLDSNKNSEKYSVEISKLNKKVENLAKLYSNRVANTSAPKSSKSSSKEISGLKKEIDSLNKLIYTQSETLEKLNKGGYATEEELNILGEEISNINLKLKSSSTGKNPASGKVPVSEVSEELINMKKTLAGLKKDLNSQKEQMAMLARNSVSSKSSKKSAGKVKSVNSNMYSDLDSKIEKMQKNLNNQKAEIDKLASREKKSYTSTGADGEFMSFWAKVSIGFSTIALFFMAR